ncbi:MAG: hypothetical protein LBQ00_07245 [Syntrophobacterales bacterium]|jgi:uncharacterized protein YcfL|nr:hypothetical protein [Syntrophobacterales bacterium]
MDKSLQSKLRTRKVVATLLVVFLMVFMSVGCSKRTGDEGSDVTQEDTLQSGTVTPGASGIEQSQTSPVPKATHKDSSKSGDEDDQEDFESELGDD